MPFHVQPFNCFRHKAFCQNADAASRRKLTFVGRTSSARKRAETATSKSYQAAARFLKVIKTAGEHHRGAGYSGDFEIREPFGSLGPFVPFVPPRSFGVLQCLS